MGRDDVLVIVCSNNAAARRYATAAGIKHAVIVKTDEPIHRMKRIAALMGGSFETIRLDDNGCLIANAGGHRQVPAKGDHE